MRVHYTRVIIMGVCAGMNPGIKKKKKREARRNKSFYVLRVPEYVSGRRKCSKNVVYGIQSIGNLTQMVFRVRQD